MISYVIHPFKKVEDLATKKKSINLIVAENETIKQQFMMTCLTKLLEIGKYVRYASPE